MKIREGFISNSSTTSFICDACGEVQAFPDSIGFEDMGIIEYSCGHGVCCEKPNMDDEDVQKKWEHGVRQALKEEQEDLKSRKPNRWQSAEDIQKEILKIQKVLDIKDPKEFRANLFGSWTSYKPSSLCPVCSLESINNDYVFDYIIAKFQLNLGEIHKEIKSRFKNFAEYKEWINSQENKDENP
jgi:hypothetical protein